MRNYRYKRMKLKAILVIVILLFAAIACIYFYSHTVVPSLLSSAQSYLGLRINKEIENSVAKYTYQDSERRFVSVTYSSDGKVSSVIADSNYINMTRTCISQSILKELRDGDISQIRLPLGTLFGNELTYAKGPTVKYNVIENNNFKSSVEGEFIESGINQTLHRMYLKFTVDVIISIPMKNLRIPVECKYLLSEIIIVGDVPDAFTDINRTFDDITESEIDDINDFGAS